MQRKRFSAVLSFNFACLAVKNKGLYLKPRDLQFLVVVLGVVPWRLIDELFNNIGIVCSVVAVGGGVRGEQADEREHARACGICANI